MIPERVRIALKQARELVECIRADNNGRIIAGIYMGGNGGLVSKESTEQAELVARELDMIDELYP